MTIAMMLQVVVGAPGQTSQPALLYVVSVNIIEQEIAQAT